MSKKLKVGIIGCGGIALAKHAPSIKIIPEAEIVAYCDIVPERAEKMRDEFETPDAKTYKDYKKLLEDDTIDVIHVCTPNKSHAPITVASLKAGKHVICEKPMATTYKDAKLMCDTAKEEGKVFTIGYQYRCQTAPLYVNELCRRGDLGEIYFAKAHAIRRRGIPTWGVFLNEEEQGGGSLIDIGTHALDMTLWMMDNYKPKSVTGTIYKNFKDRPDCGNGMGRWKPEDFTVEDSAFGFVTMENGATIILETSWALNIVEEGEAICTLCGSKAGIDMRNGVTVVSDDLGSVTMTKPSLNVGGVAYTPELGALKPEQIEARNFYASILHGEELRVKPEHALAVTQILEGIYESAKTGKQVFFN